MAPAEPVRLLHVAARAEYELDPQATHYAPQAFAQEGFVHCCSPAQLAGVLGRYFGGRDDLLLLELAAESLDAPLVFEDSTGRGEDFPHVDGPLPRRAVLRVRRLRVTSDGRGYGVDV